MKLQNNVGYSTSRFRIDLSYFDNIFHMLFDTIILDGIDMDMRKINQIFTLEKLTKDLSVKVSKNDNLNTFISLILSKIEDKILDTISVKEKDHVIYVNKSEANRSIGSYIVDGTRPITPTIVSNEIEENIKTKVNLEEFVKELIRPRYKVLYARIVDLANRSVKKKLIVCDELEDVLAYPISVTDVDLSKYSIVEADPDVMIFNPIFLEKVLDVMSTEWKLYEVLDETTTVGFIIDDVLLPLIDITEIINVQKRGNYVWQMIKYVYGAHLMQKSMPDDIHAFRKSAMKPSLNKLLTYLKYNFYLPEDLNISKAYKKYFELVYLYDKIDHIDKFQICTNARARGTNLGIYTPEKIDKEYNLLHWFTGSIDELRHYNSVEARKTSRVTKIQVLKPPFSYYLLNKYFEDIIATCLDEIGVDYVSNMVFKVSPDRQFEADFIVRLKDRMLIIEAKTRLSETTIRDAIEQKVVRMRECFGDTFHNYSFDYVICAQFADERLGLIEHFMTKVSKSPNAQFNNVWSYDFYIGEGKPKQVNQVRCISEPSIKRLKNKLAEICKN